MSQKEFQRVKVIENAAGGRLSVREASRLLQLSERQVRRLKRRYRARFGRLGAARQSRTLHALGGFTSPEAVDLDLGPGRPPIGQRFGLVDEMEPVTPDIEVIGVIPDRKYRDLRERPPAQAYFPYLDGVHFRFMNIYLRTQIDPRQIENELLERMRQFDPHVPVVELQTMNEQIGFSLRTERLVASLSGVFGGLATLVAVIGLYGVMAYIVMRRTREIGIRIALGALRSNVIAMVMREVFILIGAGLVAGFSLALALANLVRGQLYGLNPRDPLTFIGAAIVLTLAAGLAGFIPAFRASGVDPTNRTTSGMNF